jgi:surface antigen
MRKALALFIGCISTFSVNANDGNIELLAGVEAGIDTTTAMSDLDLIQTQLILSQQPVGSSKGWTSNESRLNYDITIHDHYTLNNNPCVDYSLTMFAGEYYQTQRLHACRNAQNQWISSYESTTTN